MEKGEMHMDTKQDNLHASKGQTLLDECWKWQHKDLDYIKMMQNTKVSNIKILEITTVDL